jgi:hypothetical protein
MNPITRVRLSQLVPTHFQRSPLLAQGGYDVFAGLLSPTEIERMRSEALQAARHAVVSEQAAPDHEEVRGGAPARKFRSAPGGPIQDAFYHAPHMLHFLQAITGLQVTTTGQRGTYTYYARPGDYLALHRDIETCELAIITCLYNNQTDRESHYGCLHVYPGRRGEPLSAIRQYPEQGVVKVDLEPGQTIVLFGGIVPHFVAPTAPRQVRIVSVLCYMAK